MKRELPTGRDLKAERARAGLTQAELGVALGVSRQRIGMIEGSIRPPLSIAERYLIALLAESGR